MVIVCSCEKENLLRTNRQCRSLGVFLYEAKIFFVQIDNMSKSKISYFLFVCIDCAIITSDDGFQDRSKIMTLLAEIRFMPTPPAVVEIKYSLKANGCTLMNAIFEINYNENQSYCLPYGASDPSA